MELRFNWPKKKKIPCIIRIEDELRDKTLINNVWVRLMGIAEYLPTQAYTEKKSR